MTIHSHVLIRGLVAIAVFSATGCGVGHVQGNGHLVEMRAQLAAFSGVEIDASLRAQVSVGEQAVVLDIDDNIVPLIEVTVEGGRLVVQRCGGCSDFTASAQAVARVSSPMVESLAVSGAASMTAEANGASLGLEASGVGVLAAHATAARTVRIDASGDSSVGLSGTAPELTVSTSGASAVQSTSLTTVLDVTASGAARVSAGASQSARVKASGNSAVSVSGAPGDCQVDLSGSAAVVFPGSHQ